VPDFSRGVLAASGVILYRLPASSVSGNPVEELVPVIPTVQRAFAPTDKVSAYLNVYQSEGEPRTSVSVRCGVTNAAGKTRVERPLDLADERPGGRIAVDLPLSLSELGAGHYLLTITVQRGESRVDRQVRFDIVEPPRNLPKPQDPGPRPSWKPHNRTDSRTLTFHGFASVI
jgi:hypothetical protein